MTPVRWSSNPIKVNRWNFVSFVPNVTSIKMTPLWSYDSMDSHWIGVWIHVVNGTWIPLISPTSWKRNTSSRCWRTQDWIEIVGLVCKCQLHFLCFSSKYVMSWSQMKSFHVMFWPAFTHSHIPIKLIYACHIFVWSCNLSLIGPICGPSMFVTCVEHNETYDKWILGHVHHVRMTHQFVYGLYDKLWSQQH